MKQLAVALGGVTINAKGRHDIISDGKQGMVVYVTIYSTRYSIHIKVVPSFWYLVFTKTFDNLCDDRQKIGDKCL